MFQTADRECQASIEQLHKATAQTSANEMTSFIEQQNEQMDVPADSDLSDSDTDDGRPDDMLLHNRVSNLLYDVGEELFVAADDEEMDYTHDGPKMNTARKSYECYECHQLFTHSSSLARHTLVHSGIKPYTCDICNKSFAQPGHLDIHKRTHTGEKPYSCDTCNKAFIDSTHLARHKRIHADEKSYTCDICNKSFRQLGTLNIHKRTHTGLRPFTCDVCNKGFVDSTHLTIHKRNHTGERPYVCGVCSKAFMNSSHLNRHKLIHVDEKPPTCDICNKSFTKRTSLTVHKRIHTSMKSKPSTKSRPGADTRPPKLLVTPPPMNLCLRKRIRAKPDTAKPSAEASPSSVRMPTGPTDQNQIEVGAKSTAVEPVAVVPPSAGLLINPHVMPPFAGVFPVVRFPMFDVGSALLRLPALSKLAEMRHVAK